MGIKTTFAYVCDTPRCKASAQEAAMLAHPSQPEIWVEDRDVSPFKVGKLRQSFDLLIKKLRKGDTLLVYKLFVMAPGQRDRHKRLVLRMKALAAEGVHVEQIDPRAPLHSKHPGDRDMMLAQAMADLSRVGQHKSSGRPKRQYPPDEVAIVKRHWKLAEHVRDSDALAAMKRDGLKGWSRSVILHAKNSDGTPMFGPSGRPYTKRAKAKKHTNE
jgi:hypothetical protein